MISIRSSDEDELADNQDCDDDEEDGGYESADEEDDEEDDEEESDEIDRGMQKALSNAPKTANEYEGPNAIAVSGEYRRGPTAGNSCSRRKSTVDPRAVQRNLEMSGNWLCWQESRIESTAAVI
jgi:hypothetical protein